MGASGTMIAYGIAFMGAAVAALVLAPLAARIAVARGIVDQPDVRKVHRSAVPYLGGLAIFLAVIAGIGAAFASGLGLVLPSEPLDSRVLLMLLGATAMFGLGLVDDVRHVRARYKLLVQVVAATGVFAAGVRIESVRISESVLLEFGVFSYPITIMWIVGLTNAVNLIDGVDGLAAGICSIGCAAIAWVAYQSGQPDMALLMLAILGALIGFLRYNLHPARIFMGDSGSMFLGFVLSSATVYCAAKSATFVGLAVPAVALGIPILDTIFSMARRFLERRSMLSPDRNHIHHRLLALGFGQRRVVQLLCFETAFATVLGILLMGTGSWIRFVAFFAMIAVHLTLFRTTGAVRLRESYRKFRRTAAILREVSEQKQDFEDLGLRLVEAENFEEWWDVICLAGQRLGFASLEMEVPTRAGAVQRLRWSSGIMPTCEQRVEAKLPVRQRRRGEPVLVRIVVHASLSLESIGRRLAFFGRLLDERSLAELSPHPAAGDSADRAPPRAI